MGLYLGAEMVIPIVRPRFSTNPSGELFETGPIAFEGTVGLEFRGWRRE